MKFGLDNQLIPVYNYPKDVVLLDDKQVGKSIKAPLPIFKLDFEMSVPKIAVLRELRVPALNLSLLATRYPYVLRLVCKQLIEL